MKRVLTACIFVCVFLFRIMGEAPTLFEVTGDHYRVFSEVSQEHAQNIDYRLEALLSLFNRYFHFDMDSMEEKFNVKIFKSNDEFNDYIFDIIGIKKNSFIYLQYATKADSELVAFAMDEGDFQVALNTYAFIQFMKIMIKNPPLWLQRGFLIFFKNSQYDETGSQMAVRPDFQSVNLLKETINNNEEKMFSISALLAASPEQLQGDMGLFSAESYLFIDFLIRSPNKDYNRLLWDSISTMNLTASLEANQQEIRRKVFQWVDINTLFEDFKSYILSMKTLNDWFTEGKNLYAGKKYQEAIDAFNKALALDPAGKLVNYFLGLAYYGAGKYPQAQEHFLKALVQGKETEKGIIYYALGINSFEAKAYAEAEEYLTMAKEADPENFNEKAEALITRIKKSRSQAGD